MTKRKRKKQYTKEYLIAAVLAVFFVLLSCLGLYQSDGQESHQMGDGPDFQIDENSGESEHEEANESVGGGAEAPIGEESTDESAALPEVQGTMTVHFLDVGQGLSIFVQCDGKNLIYDGGDRDTSSYVVAYLKNMGVETIDYLISSHYDSDHVSGLIGCLNVFDVKEVIGSNYVHDSKSYQSFTNKVKELGLAIQYPAVGTTYSFGSGSFVVLAPQTIDENDSNANSVAIKLIHGDNTFLFTGDAEFDSEKAMCESGIDISCDVLVPGHHGSATATSSEFLMKTVPEYAVISCGKGNAYGHPHEAVMEKLEAMEVQIYRTDQQGYISAVSDGQSLLWNQEPCNNYSSGEELQ